MLVEEFAKKHDLCEAGHEMMRPFLNKTVREWWEDASQANRGTWLFWLVSRAGLDHKTIVRAACRCCRDVLPVIPEPAPAQAAIEAMEAWASGQKSRDEARAAGTKALAAANAAKQNKAVFVAWSGIYHTSKCLDSPIHAPGVTGALATALELAGKCTYAEAEAKFASYVRSAFTWRELETALSENRPSPLPRPATPEEISEQTAKRLAEYTKLLGGLETACGTLTEFCQQQNISLDGISRALDHDGMGDAIRKLVQDAVKGLEAADARPVGAAAEKPKAPKRSRMMV